MTVSLSHSGFLVGWIMNARNVDEMTSLAHVHEILKVEENTCSLGWVPVLMPAGELSSVWEQQSLLSHMSHSSWDPHLV